MGAKDRKECRIRVGEVVIQLECASPGYAASVAEYFGVTGTAGDPHIRLKLNILPRGGVREIPESLLTT